MIPPRPNSHRMRRTTQRKQMGSVVVNGSVHTVRKQHQRKNVPLEQSLPTDFMSTLLWLAIQADGETSMPIKRPCLFVQPEILKHASRVLCSSLRNNVNLTTLTPCSERTTTKRAADKEFQSLLLPVYKQQFHPVLHFLQVMVKSRLHNAKQFLQIILQTRAE